MENAMSDFLTLSNAMPGEQSFTKSLKPEVEAVSIRLFVGRVPSSVEEADVQNLFEEEGPVLECQIIRQKGTGLHKSSAFVKMASLTDADSAVRNFHNKRTFPGQSSGPIQVKYANGEVERLGLTNESVDPGVSEGTLFVGSVPKTLETQALKNIFDPYGEIASAYILKDTSGTSKGCGFVKFNLKEQAIQAREALNGKLLLEGATRPLDIRFAKGKGQGPQAQAQAQAQVQALNIQQSASSPPSAHNAQSVPNLTQSQQFALAALLANPASLAALTAQPQPTMLPSLTPKPVTPSNWREITLPDGNTYYYNQITNATTWQKPAELEVAASPMGQPSLNLGALLGSGQMSGLPALSPMPQVAPSMVPQTIPQGVAGPPGANVFLFHIPHDWQQNDVVTHFAAYGKIVSVTVPMDLRTQVTNRGFAFLGYDDVQSAVNAVTHMNGFMVGSKRLKVSIKKGEEEHAAPFLKATQHAVSESSNE